MPADVPRLFRDLGAIARRRAMLSEPHVAPLAEFARSLRGCGHGEVPDFDPRDGGIRARILFLFEKPGPMAAKSGFISRDNDDESAASTFRFMNAAGIPREQTCTWNLIPGWNGMIKVTEAELERGFAALHEALRLLPDLRGVVLVGKRAARARQFLESKLLGVIESAHPSGKVRARWPDRWKQIPIVWAEAKRFLE